MKTGIPTLQAHGLYRRTIGDLVVTTIVDGSETFSFDIFSKNITTEEAKNLLVGAGLPPVPRMPVNAYIVQDGDRTVLIDSGDGNCQGTGGRLHDALAALKIEASAVDTILLTHAHPDHMGGLAGPNGSPHFPNAELVLHADELAFWQTDENFRNAPYLHEIRDQARNTFKAYSSALRTATGGEVVSGISLQPLPGHTPGHSGYLVHSGNESVLIWGDLAHWPDIQIPRPEVTLDFDMDPTQMVQTRKRLLQQVTSDNTLIGGMHLNFPGFIRIHSERGVYGFHEERWQPDLP